MSSFLYTLLLIFIAAASLKEIPAADVNDCPRFDYEYKLLERFIKAEYAQKETENTLLQLQKEVKTLKTNLEERSIEIRKLLDNESKRIESKVFGFSVSTTVPFDSLKVYQVILFNDVIYDPYKAYNTITGTYTVPVSGTYLITGSIFCEPGKRLQTQIIAGGQLVTRLYARSSDTFDQGANSVVVDLRAGNTVFMRVDEHGSDAMVAGRWSSLSAICLKPASSTSS